MFPQENEYKSLLSKNAHGSPNFDKAACTTTSLKNYIARKTTSLKNIQHRKLLH